MKVLALTGLVAGLAISLATAAHANVILNGSFQTGDFTDWTLGTTSNGTAGSGYPIVTTWPLGGMNAWKGEVGEVNFDGTFQGATLSQTFAAVGPLSLSFDYAAMGDGTHTNADGGEFVLLLDGTALTSHDVGTIDATQTIDGVLSATADVGAGSHTLEIDILRRFTSDAGNTPYQYVTAVDVEGGPVGVPEPGSLAIISAGLLGLTGLRRRRCAHRT